MNRLVVPIVIALTPSLAHAFCGFYVSGSADKMFADATQVVLMREGTRTVLSMQNDYKGPLADFAMVVPVPVVLKKESVKTLKPEIFDHVEQLGAPRLVEYWEQDPCPEGYFGASGTIGMGSYGTIGYGYGGGGISNSVRVEAQFKVAEYEIVVLSATEAAGLETWLRDHSYKIPDAAAPLLRPYVEAGSKFFVAKVDPKKVKMVGGHAALSPLRFHYDSDEFALPIRLGLASSSGKQDLIVNIISPTTRYEVANYKNAFIPTNLDVKPAVKARFAEFYAALFDKTIAANPGAVITEYAWTAQRGYHCDPCPPIDVTDDDLLALGGDVIKSDLSRSFVMTRLHARYGKTDLNDDLRFKEASPVAGGREEYAKGALESEATASKQNFFQARYAVRHPWTGPIKCKEPQRGMWGGPPDGNAAPVLAASKLAFAPRGKLVLADMLGRDTTAKKRKPKPIKTMALGAIGVLGLAAFALRRRRRG